MDRICEPQTGLTQAFKLFHRLTPFASETYDRNLHVLSVLDCIGGGFLQTKLAYEIKEVP
jgi:hypothetical protein